MNIFRIKLGDLYTNKNLLFTKYDGTCMGITTPTQWWKKFAHNNEITPGVTFHSLRHSAASMMINAGTDVATVSRTLGHSNISTTLNIYTHLIEDSKKKAIETVAEHFIAK